jgi:hypothetical protein
MKTTRGRQRCQCAGWRRRTALARDGEAVGCGPLWNEGGLLMPIALCTGSVSTAFPMLLE